MASVGVELNYAMDKGGNPNLRSGCGSGLGGGQV
jgi:hypothetical protein